MSFVFQPTIAKKPVAKADGRDRMSHLALRWTIFIMVRRQEIRLAAITEYLIFPSRDDLLLTLAFAKPPPLPPDHPISAALPPKLAVQPPNAKMGIAGGCRYRTIGTLATGNMKRPVILPGERDSCPP